MAIFSWVLLGLTFLNFFRTKKIKSILVAQSSITIFICTFINVGYFIKSDILNVEYYQAAIIIQFLVSLVVILKNGGKIKSKSLKRLMFYIGSLTITLILLIFLPEKSAEVTGAGGYFESYMLGHNAYMSPVFEKFAIFFYFLAIILAIDFEIIISNLTNEEYKIIITNISNMGKKLIILVLIEFLIKNIIRTNLYSVIITFIFGEGTSTYVNLVKRGSLFMLQGLTREGSHFAYGMMILLIIFFVEKRLGKKNKLWFILGGIELFLAGTFTAVWCIFFLALFYIIYLFFNNSLNRKRTLITKRKVFLIVSVVLAILLVGIIILLGENYLSDRMIELIGIFKSIKKYDINYFRINYHISSSQTRMYSIKKTFLEYLKRPLFGLGLGTTYCYSDMILTLTEIGIIGVITYAKYYFNAKRDNCNKRIYNLCAILWLICNILCIFHVRMIVAVDIWVIIIAMKILFENRIE